MGDYRKLDVWRRAHEVTLEVYRVTRTFPREEQFGLTSQVRRAASSVPANIAEGGGRNGDAELARFLSIAMGSANELDYHLLLAGDLGYLKPEDFDHLSTEVKGVARMLASFIDRLRQPSPPRSTSVVPIADSR